MAPFTQDPEVELALRIGEAGVSRGAKRFQLWQGGFSLVAPGIGGGVAFFAHIGGFVFGLLVAQLFAVRRRPRIAGPW